MKPFIMVSTRPEIEAAEAEYESFLALGGLDREELQHLFLEEIDALAPVTATDVSGMFIGGSPFDASTPEHSRTRSQLQVEEQVRELLAVAFKEGVPVLATGFGLEVLAGYLGTETSRDFGEELGTSTVHLTQEGRQDPVLAELPESFTAFVGHHEGAITVPQHAVLLATSADCPVQMIRVGTKVYGTQFNPELDAERFIQRTAVYVDAGYGNPGMVEDLVAEARSDSDHVAGRIIRGFVQHFSRD